MCYEAGIEVTSLPGPAACITALTLSGLHTRRFAFEAFLPADKKERKTILEELSCETRTIILYEAPHRLVRTLGELREALGNRRMTLCRELTKKHETAFRTTIDDLMDFYKDGSGIAFGKVAENAGKVEFGWPLLLSEPLGVDQGGTGAETASAACTKLGAVKKAGDTMTGNLAISGYLYPSLYLLPTYNSTTNRTVFEGSYVGASSFSSWEDGTGNNRRMLEVRNAAYQASLDFAVLLRTCTGGTWASYRLFHAGMATPIPLVNGGTGASSAKAALSNLGIFYSASLPSSGTDGQICLVPV